MLTSDYQTNTFSELDSEDFRDNYEEAIADDSVAFSPEANMNTELIAEGLKECLDNLDLKKHLYKINEHRGFLDKKAENIFSFQKFRKDFNPIIKNEITGKTRQIDLKENESLLEENYLYWDFKNDMVFFQYNYHGFTPLNFENYIKLFFSNTFKDDFFTLKAVMTKTGYEALVNSNLVKSFELRVAEPSISMLNDLGLDSEAIIKIDDGVATGLADDFAHPRLIMLAGSIKGAVKPTEKATLRHLPRLEEQAAQRWC